MKKTNFDDKLINLNELSEKVELLLSKDYIFVLGSSNIVKWL